MELHEIVALLDRFDASSCTGLELTQGEFRLTLDKAAAQANPAPAAQLDAAQPTPAQPQPIAEEGHVLKAPLVGTFYAAPAQGQPPFVSAGDRVRKGQTVCVLEAMKMLSEVPAPMDCVIEAVLAGDGELVGFDAPLFRIREA